MKLTARRTLQAVFLLLSIVIFPQYFYSQTIPDPFYVAGAVRFPGLTTDNTQSKIVAADASGNLFLKDVSSFSNPALWLNSGTHLYYNSGNVGIGTSTPAYKLDVAGSIHSSTGLHTSGSVRFGGLTTDNAQTKVLVTDANGNVFNRDISTISSSSSSYWTASGNDIFNQNTGNIGIGTNPQSAYKLAVNGVIGARKVKVTAETWADYVFEKNYHLPTLQEVEKFIQQHKHLPDVPSAKDVKENGLDLGDNQALLLKKIEELTLYMIELNKEVKRLGAENELLKKKIKH